MLIALFGAGMIVGMAIASGQGFASTGLVGAFPACAGILVFGVTLFDARRRAFAA